MSGPKRNPDKLNTIGVVVVGICGAVLVYVTIVALQAFYMNDTSEIQTMADYGGQDMTAKGRRADEMRNITEPGKNAVAEGQQPTFRIPIDVAMKLVEQDAKKDPAHLVPALPRAEKASIEPVFGRPKPMAAPAPAGGASGAAPGAGGAVTPPPPATDLGAPTAPQTPTGGAGPGGAGASPATPAAQPQPPAATTPAPGATPARPGATAPAPQPKAGAQPAQPKAGAAPKAGAQPTPAQPAPKAGAQPAPKAGAPAPAQPAQPKTP